MIKEKDEMLHIVGDIDERMIGDIFAYIRQRPSNGKASFDAVLASRGGDPAVGRKIARLLRESGRLSRLYVISDCSSAAVNILSAVAPDSIEWVDQVSIYLHETSYFTCFDDSAFEAQEMMVREERKFDAEYMRIVKDVIGYTNWDGHTDTLLFKTSTTLRSSAEIGGNSAGDTVIKVRAPKSLKIIYGFPTSGKTTVVSNNPLTVVDTDDVIAAMYGGGNLTNWHAIASHDLRAQILACYPKVTPVALVTNFGEAIRSAEACCFPSEAPTIETLGEYRLAYKPVDWWIKEYHERLEEAIRHGKRVSKDWVSNTIEELQHEGGW